MHPTVRDATTHPGEAQARKREYSTMNKQTTERAFETYVEEILQHQSGWTQGTNAEWDKKNALFPERIFSFLKATQSPL